MSIEISVQFSVMAFMSIVLCVLMGVDKYKAITGKRRIPEAVLFLFAFLLGAPGGLVGMYSFRHKTRHWYFVLGFWLLSLIQLGSAFWLSHR